MISTRRTTRTRRYRFAVQLQEKRFDDFDGTVRWLPIRDLYADIIPKVGKLVIEGRQEAEIVKYEVTIPWHPDGIGQGERRIVHSDTNYYIESSFDVGEDHREYKFVCTLRDGG